MLLFPPSHTCAQQARCHKTHHSAFATCRKLERQVSLQAQFSACITVSWSISGQICRYADALCLVGSPVRAVSGGFTFAFFACSAQLAFNQLNVLRVNYIKRQEKPVQEWSKELGELDAPRPEPVEEKPPFTQRMTEAVLSVTPIRKVSNEEYAETLKTRIQRSEQELSVVKRQMEDIQEQLDHAHKEKKASV